jgi:hypothetical protein
MYDAHSVGCNIFKWLKIFHPTYTCIIHVLNAQRPCAKNMTPWNYEFCVNFKRTYEVSKFLMKWVYKIYGWTDSYVVKWLFHQHLDNKHALWEIASTKTTLSYNWNSKNNSCTTQLGITITMQLSPWKYKENLINNFSCQKIS